MSRHPFKSFQFLLLGLTAALVLVYFFQTQVMDLDRHTSESQDILHLKQLDTLLEEEALKAASLQLNHYDNIVVLVGEISGLLAKLQDPEKGIYGTISPTVDHEINSYIKAMTTKIDLIETIKSRLAIVRNSINFLPTEVARITMHSHKEIDIEFNHVLITLLSQNVNPSPSNLKKFEVALAHLEAFRSKPDTSAQDKKNITLIVSHAKANMKAYTDTSALFNEFLTLPTRTHIEQIFVAHSHFAFNRIETTNQFRIVLLALSMLLFVGLGRALYNLRAARFEAEHSSRQLIDALESISEGFALFDKDGKLQFWNKTFERLHKNCGTALNVGTAFQDFFETCTKSGTYLAIQTGTSSTDSVEAPGLLNHAYTVQGQNGTWMLASDSPMNDGGTACVRIDITENKRAEQEMRKLSQAVEQSPASVVITDTKGEIVYVNPKFCEATGYSVEEALGNNPRLINSGERSQQDYQELWQTIAAGQEWRGEFHNKRKDGSLFWEFASISAIKDENGTITHYLGIKEDITERKEDMVELIKAKETAELANHAKSQFLANMSHELRTPLNAVIGFSEILKEQMFGPLGSDQYLEYTVNIHESGQHLLDVINDILDVSRIEIGSMDIRESAVDIKALCQSCVDMHQDQASHAKVSLHVNIDEDLSRVNGDETRLKQILINVLTNAIKFTPEGGRIDLKAFLNEDREITLQVIDTGIGISKDKHQKILEPFEQVSDIFSRSHEGSGLGLYLVKSFINLHGGRFDIESEIDQGSTFTITLPSSRTLDA